MELLELLKSIHSKGGVFEKSLNQVPLKGDLTEGVLSELFDEFVVDGTTYKIPSPQYVEERIVELATYLHIHYQVIEPVSGSPYSMWYYNSLNNRRRVETEHSDRLMAALMLWDKLLTKDEV